MNRRPPHLRVARVAATLFAVGITLSACSSGGTGGANSASVPTTTSAYQKYMAVEQHALSVALGSVHVALPTKAGAPAPALPADAFGQGLGSKVVLGFLPYWELSHVGSVDYSSLSEIAYSYLVVGPRATISKSGLGWDAIENGSVETLVTNAHSAGTRALLSIFTESESTLAQLSRSPTSNGQRLADQVAPLLQANDFDGVDLDLEGQDPGPRAGFSKLVAAFSTRLRAIDHTWSIVLNTLPQSAMGPETLYDVKALSPYVDQFFVMAYDMSDFEVPSASAPLTGSDLSDVSSLASFVATVPASKVILGIPFYGYDFTASRATPPSDAIGNPDAVTYDEIVTAGRPALWDPVSETPFASFRRGKAWHQTWYDDPTSVALKVALAGAFKVAGVGAWEVGMASGQTQMDVALDGGSTPLRLPLATQP